jgi:hypothetical protein
MRILLAILFLTPVVHALYNGNPVEPAAIEQGLFLEEDNLFSAKAGYQGTYVFDRKLRAYDGAKGRIDQCQLLFNQAVVTVNVFDRIEVYGTIGSMNAFLSHRPHVDMRRREYQTSDHPTWGVGARGLLMNWGNTSLGVNGSYQWGRPHVKWIAVDGVSQTTAAVLKYREWQVGIGVAHQVDVFIPYISLVYSHVHARMEHLRASVLPRSSFDMRNRDHFGMALGCTLTTERVFDLTVEGRVFDEQAVTLAGNLKF